MLPSACGFRSCEDSMSRRISGVLLHPTSNIDGKIIRELYGSDMALVQHEHRHEPPGESGDD